MRRRALLSTMGAAVVGLAYGRPSARAAEMPGVSATAIKIGNTCQYSGPLSAAGGIGLGAAAYFKMINDAGGIGGRKIDFITLDDGYSPPRTVEQTRRLIEQEQVAFMFASGGSPTNAAVQKYLNDRKIPQIFISTGAERFKNYKDFPWTIGWQPSYRVEAQIYAKYVLANKPDARIGILWQNDDFGKSYVAGVKDVLGDKYDRMPTKSASYEVTDPTVDSQVVSLQASGADVLITAATPKFAAQTIRKVFDLGWSPLRFMTNVSVSIGSVLQPAGLEKAAGLITADYLKDATDPRWKDDSGAGEYRAFMRKHLPDADIGDVFYAWGYVESMALMKVLLQCETDFSRESIMRQVTNLHNLELPTILPGIKVNTSPTNYHPIRQMQLKRWNGKAWELFGDIIEGSG